MELSECGRDVPSHTYLASIIGRENPHCSSALLHVPEEPESGHFVGFGRHVHIDEQHGEALNRTGEDQQALLMTPSLPGWCYHHQLQQESLHHSHFLPGPTDFVEQLLHGHLVPLFGMWSFPGSFLGNLQHGTRVKKMMERNKEDSRATGTTGALPRSPSCLASWTGCWSPWWWWGSTWEGRSCGTGRTSPDRAYQTVRILKTIGQGVKHSKK